jgi:hypothetical protein
MLAGGNIEHRLQTTKPKLAPYCQYNDHWGYCSGIYPVQPQTKQETTSPGYRGLKCHHWTRICIVPGVAVIISLGMGMASGWNLFETLYYVIITSCTMGDSKLTPDTNETKALALVLIPLLISLMLQWMIVVANWVVMKSSNQNDVPVLGNSNRKMTASELNSLLEQAKMKDGLLTRADYLEVVLLAMKKVDPDLLVALRDGFDQVSKGGSINLTLKEMGELFHNGS